MPGFIESKLKDYTMKTQEELAPNTNSLPKSQPSITVLAVIFPYIEWLANNPSVQNNKELQLLTYFQRQGTDAIPWMSFNGFFARAVGGMPYAGSRLVFDNMVSSDFTDLLTLRKLMVRYKIEDAIQKGVNHVIFLGGGYDVRALMGAINHPQVHFIEADYGITRETKINALKNLPTGVRQELKIDIEYNVDNDQLTVNHNLTYLNCDLSQDEPMLFKHLAAIKGKKLLIAEGLAVYLTERANKTLLQNIKNILGEEDELLISYEAMTSANSKTSQQATQCSNETYKFALPPERALEFIQGFDLEISSTFAAHDFLGLVDNNEGYERYKDRSKRRETMYLITRPSLSAIKINDINEVDSHTLGDLIQSNLPPQKSNNYCTIS